MYNSRESFSLSTITDTRFDLDENKQRDSGIAQMLQGF